MIGIIFCGYNQEQWVARSLAPWLALKDTHGFAIAACSLPFAEYKDFNQKKDGTQDYLLYLEGQGKIDKVFTSPEYIKETEARQLCLDYLCQKGAKVIWMVDADELYTQEQISTIIDIINKDKFIVWYKLNFKNYFKDIHTFFDEPFCPPRIFKCKVGQYDILKFIDDNHICYMDTLGELIHPSRLPTFTISKNHVWIDHPSWLDNESSKLKVQYHAKHFSDGLCSYSWDDNKGLYFNPDYYTKRNISYPILLQDNK